ncbi:DNA-directed RNA polymerase I subunit rpa43 isoform X4 [Selaginella moellendorffii]|uniref:DNA-directed RNA polymerase I subunit rpa43 isoform X4 n=1 Tax=Selaginella moellendorffii TaxID=88036 RepID=UPI000D1C55F6|nr:DNA-directed RNA polymerase I subunit rpa43 isoform X4 [Selaginella moellendorffii]|eukprot:XP_024524592.1 DNA-directed RNA polymerase I subunit rpa43 isoform X4 [Selaginella moellendorffii]
MAVPVHCAVAGKEDDPDGVEWLRSVSARIRMYLHPKCASNLEASVREVLNSMLLKFDSSFDGVLLAYFRPEILKFGHKILPLLPYFTVRLKADLLLFSPKAGMLIEGKVNKVEKDYIGMLVLGLFNAAIGINDIRQDLFYDEVATEQTWISESDERHCIRVGSRVSFLVKSVQEEDEFIDIVGSLVPPETGALDWIACLEEDKEAQQEQQTPVSEKSRSKRKTEAESSSKLKVEAEPSSSKRKEHKKKKRKREQVQEDEEH